MASLTLDCTRTNLSMCRSLGANFDGRAFIYDPLNFERKIYVFLDGAHLIKLGRNCFGTYNLVDGKGRMIKWSHVELLYETQKDLGWNLGNKLSKAHMQWAKRKMNVKLACETLSNSVADSLEFAKGMSEAFADVDGTIDYIRFLNDIFDTMNSTKSEAIGFKRPISIDTHREVFNLYDEAIEYIKGLKIEGETRSALTSNSHTPFTGFYNNMVNFKALFEDYVLTEKLEMIRTHRFSQDHLENLFGCIRGMNGFNDNPNAQQFESAFKKLLVHNDVLSSKKSNCIETGTKILTVSSHRPANNREASSSSFITGYEREIDEFIFEVDVEQLISAEQIPADHALAYKSSLLEEKIIRSQKPKLIVKCQECIEAFIQNELLQDNFIRFKARNSNVSQPCRSTFEICKFVDVFLKFFEDKTISFNAVLMQILRKIDFSSLYPLTDFDSHAEIGHKYEFVKTIVKLYLNMKSVHTARCFTLKVQKEPIRHEYLKEIHRAGQ